MKRLIALLLVAVVIISATSCNDTSSDESISVKLVVSYNEVIDNLESEDYAISDDKIDIIPENGVIYEATTSCNDGKNAFDLLIDCLKSEKIHYEASDGYIKAIGNIYEGDCGEYSGWMFYINGELAEVGSTDYIVANDDAIEFKYVVDYMKLFE